MSRIVIIGGVAGGASAAARARRMSESSEIIMLERGEFVSFANCGLPYHISGEIPSRANLVLQTPESFKRRFNVDVRVMEEVVQIDRQSKSLRIKRLADNSEYELTYDKLLLSPGAAPVVPPVPGFTLPGVFQLRNIPDMDRILASAGNARHTTVIGGGFIGLEMAEAFRHRGINTTLVEMAPQVMTPVDPEMAEPLHLALRENGVDLRLNTAVNGIEQTEGGLLLQLSTGDTLSTDLVISAIGVKPETRLAVDAGLQIGSLGGIAVNERMQTSDPDIYAVGDAVEETCFVTGQPSLIPLAGPANRQGRIAADNMLGDEKTYRHTQGTAVCRVFDQTIASTGLNEKRLKQLGQDYRKVYVHPNNHAGYFPGATPVSMKLLFDTKGKILGAQAVGKDGVDKRIDVIATAQRGNLTVFDLEHLELTYAPPYGSAKDVVNLAGFVAANWLRGDTDICYPEEVDLAGPGQIIVDVRTPGEREKLGFVEGSVSIPVDELRDRADELPKDKEILIVCQVGLRGHVAQRILAQMGYKVRNLTGGYKTWKLTR
ncbi:FAD-dependent oxidoreductase [Parasalinivibrio latis]|uniref:FAD-dependent oxidoreductase n=1 Tax=Parasalinivibrio latis TaxID=2952610 RepID=UPI0030E44DBA